MKKIIFFDGDGTLWYPKATKYSEKPWWIYAKPHNAHRLLTLIPYTKPVLRRLRRMGLILVVISGQPPVSFEGRLASLMRVIRYLGIANYFDEFRPSKVLRSRGGVQWKDRTMVRILKERRIPKSQALMVGDMYHHDYLAAKRAGIDVVIVGDYAHTKQDKNYRKIKNREKDLRGVFKYLS